MIVRNPYALLKLNDSLFASVASYDEETSETVVPNGETWIVRAFAGSASRLDDNVASLVWDYGGAGETILAATHGDAVIHLAETITGDGSKILAIVLTNDTGAARVMGGQWQAERD